MNSFILNITASSGEFYQGSCESMVLPVKDGVYGVQAGHSPVLVAIHMGMLKFTVDGETREILVGDGIAEVTPTFVLLLVDSAERPEDIDKNRAEAPASAPKSACSISRACTSITRPRSLWTAPCSVCRPLPNTSDKRTLSVIASQCHLSRRARSCCLYPRRCMSSPFGGAGARSATERVFLFPLDTYLAK